MEKEFENFEYQHIRELINRFEEVAKAGGEPYFDVEEFEEIIDYYDENRNFSFLDKALSTANKIHPGHSYFHLKQAQRFGSSGNYRQAERILKDILASEPHNLATLQYLAFLYSQNEKHKESIGIQHEIIAAGGLVHEAWLNIATEYQNMGKYEIALSYLKKILKNYPGEESAMFEVMFCYESLNKTDEAIDFFKEFTDAHPYSAGGWFNLGIAYSTTGLFEKAIEAYDFVIAIEDHYSSAYFNKGNAYMSLEKFPEAIKCFKETFEYEPEDSITYLYIARCYSEMSEYEDAIRHYFKALELNDRQSEAWAGIGIVYHLVGRPEKAKSYLEEALRLEPDNIDYIAGLSGVLMDMEDFEESEKLLLKLNELQKDNVENIYFLAEVYFLSGKYGEGLELIEDALQKFPGNISLLFKKADILREMNMLKESKIILEKIGINSFNELDLLIENPDKLDEFLHKTQ